MPDDPSVQKPLQNISVLVACSAKKMSALTDGLRASGAEVLPFPVIEIKDVEDKAPLDKALASINKYAWIIFTSSHGVLFFTQRFHERKTNMNMLQEVKICAIGPGTAKTLQENGFKPDLVPEQFVAEGVLAALQKHYGGRLNLSGCPILLPRPKEARDVLPKALSEAGAIVDTVVCYQTVKAELSDEEKRRFTSATPDLIVFTSSSTVKNTIDSLGYSAGKKLLDHSAVAAIGPITTATLESFGKRVDIVPKESTIASLVEAIRQWAVSCKQ